jgi:hypothetical protein
MLPKWGKVYGILDKIAVSGVEEVVVAEAVVAVVV